MAKKEMNPLKKLIAGLKKDLKKKESDFTKLEKIVQKGMPDKKMKSKAAKILGIED
jgi:hypothetical protein